MANWIYKLNFKDLWKARDEKKITIQELGKEIRKRIRKLSCYEEQIHILEVIAYGFEHITEDVDEFDDILNELYDWADTPLPTPKRLMQRRMCWIRSF